MKPWSLALVALLLSGCAGATPAVEAPRPGAAPAVEAPRAAESAAVMEAARRPVFMFAVDREGLPTSYLHGSVHMLRDTDEGREPAIDEAFEQAEALVVELDMQNVDQQALQLLTLQLGTYPAGEDLTSRLSPQAWEALMPKLASFGLHPEGAKRMRPWLLAITLGVLNLQRKGLSPEAGVDARYLGSAHDESDPREVIQLETAEEQLRALAALPDEVQHLMLDDTVKRLDDETFFNKLFDAWRSGDVEGLAEVVFGPLRDEPRYAPMYQLLFFERNRRMTERLVALFDKRKRHFVVVGAAHLVGPESIPELLRARGFTVQQVFVPAAVNQVPAPAPAQAN